MRHSALRGVNPDSSAGSALLLKAHSSSTINGIGGHSGTIDPAQKICIVLPHPQVSDSIILFHWVEKRGLGNPRYSRPLGRRCTRAITKSRGHGTSARGWPTIPTCGYVVSVRLQCGLAPCRNALGSADLCIRGGVAHIYPQVENAHRQQNQRGGPDQQNRQHFSRHPFDT